jgi:hypothetical protein
VGGSVHAVHKKAEALVVASKETGLEVNADKSKYMAMSQDQNTGRSHNIKNDNISFERVEEFKYTSPNIDRVCSTSSLLYNGYRVFPVGKAAGAWCWPPTPF